MAEIWKKKKLHCLEPSTGWICITWHVITLQTTTPQHRVRTPVRPYHMGWILFGQVIRHVANFWLKMSGLHQAEGQNFLKICSDHHLGPSPIFRGPLQKGCSVKVDLKICWNNTGEFSTPSEEKSGILSQKVYNMDAEFAFSQNSNNHLNLGIGPLVQSSMWWNVLASVSCVPCDMEASKFS